MASWEALATANRFIVVVYRPGTYRFSRAVATLWFGPLTVPWQPIPIPDCGAGGEGPCDDKPGMIALVRFVLRTQNVDPASVFVTGASKGGNFVVELMCSPSTNGLFRGFGIVSAPLVNSGPSLNLAANTCRLVNRDSSVLFEAGEADDFVAYDGRGVGSHYFEGQQDGASYLAGRYGCRRTPATTVGTGGTLRRDVYSSCARPARAVGLISVPHGGHAYGIDGAQGLNSEAELWNFWVAH